MNKRFYCTKCNYTFVPKTQRKPKRCPYCDKVGTITDAKSAQDYLNELGRENW